MIHENVQISAKCRRIYCPLGPSQHLPPTRAAQDLSYSPNRVARPDKAADATIRPPSPSPFIAITGDVTSTRNYAPATASQPLRCRHSTSNGNRNHANRRRQQAPLAPPTRTQLLRRPSSAPAKASPPPTPRRREELPIAGIDLLVTAYERQTSRTQTLR